MSFPEGGQCSSPLFCALTSKPSTDLQHVFLNVPAGDPGGTRREGDDGEFLDN